MQSTACEMKRNHSKRVGQRARPRAVCTYDGRCSSRQPPTLLMFLLKAVLSLRNTRVIQSARSCSFWTNNTVINKWIKRCHVSTWPGFKSIKTCHEIEIHGILSVACHCVVCRIMVMEQLEEIFLRRRKWCEPRGAHTHWLLLFHPHTFSYPACQDNYNKCMWNEHITLSPALHGDGQRSCVMKSATRYSKGDARRWYHVLTDDWTFPTPCFLFP